MKDFILNALEEIQNGYSLCGVVDRRARVYPLGSDTKVISTLFEIVVRQVVAAYADHAKVNLIEPKQQNHYPDFTLATTGSYGNKIALDVKTTYRGNAQSTFNYTLGSYTSYMHPETEGKNIVFPYSQYAEHWIIGFCYRRSDHKRDTSGRIYSFDTLSEMPVPFDDVEVFMQEKWRIAGDKAGSGNTAVVINVRGIPCVNLNVEMWRTRHFFGCVTHTPHLRVCDPHFTQSRM